MKGRVFRSIAEISAKNSIGQYDVTIIGGGIVGLALSRTLALRNKKVCLIEKAYDFGEGASKSNSAIIHTGFDATPGSLECELVTFASREWKRLAEDLCIPYEVPGALMLARTPEELMALEKYHKNSIQNGVTEVSMISGRYVKEQEPQAAQVLGALKIHNEALIDPFTTCAAFAHDALMNGVDFYFSHVPVSIARASNGIECIIAESGVNQSSKPTTSIHSSLLVNAAGLGAVDVAALYGGAQGYRVNPRRGQFLIYDTILRRNINHILLPVPSSLGKGVLVSPTIFGNIIAGPTAEDLPPGAIDATQTTQSGLMYVKTLAEEMVPYLKFHQPIGQYAGARANCDQGSFVIHHNDNIPGVTTLLGVRSTGVSASFTLANRIATDLFGLSSSSYRRRNHVIFQYPAWFTRKQLENSQSKELIDSQPEREVICFCQNASKDEIESLLDDSTGLIPGHTDTVKRRTRAMTGRCQGFNCLHKVCSVIADSRNIPLHQVTKKGPGTEWFPYARNENKPEISQDTYSSLLGKASDRSSREYDYVVIGGGPAGVGAFLGLTRDSRMRVLMIERSSSLGGIPAKYWSSPNKKTFFKPSKMALINGGEYAQALRKQVSERISSNPENFCVQLGALVTDIELNKAFQGQPATIHTTSGVFTATKGVFLATGSREKTSAERLSASTSITGHRPAGVMFSSNVLDSGGVESVASQDSRIVSLGAGLISHGTTAPKTNAQAISSPSSLLIPFPQDSWPGIARLWFRHGTLLRASEFDEIRIQEHSTIDKTTTAKHELRLFNKGNHVEVFELHDGAASLTIVSDSLTPNDELVLRDCRNFNFRFPLGSGIGCLQTVGNVFLIRFPASICYWHGYLQGVWARWSNHVYRNGIK